jgi:hypothetical protein
MCPGHGSQDGPSRPSSSAAGQDNRDALPDWENLALPPPHVLSHRECPRRVSFPDKDSPWHAPGVATAAPDTDAPLYLPVSTPDNQIYVPCQTRSRRSHRCALSSHRHPARLWDVRPGPPWGPRSDGDDTGGPRSGGGVIPAEAVGGGYSFPRETEDAGEGATKGTPSSGLFRWVRLTRSFDTTASHREAESVQSSSHQKSLHCSARSAWLVHG